MISTIIIMVVERRCNINTTITLPDKKYSIIYADPPWMYRDKASAGKRGACFKYPVMGIDAIKNLPVKNIVLPDSLLFLWITMPFLREGLEVISSWDFVYKTCAFTWIKSNPKSGGFFMGMGNWTRSNSELCLLGVRGSPKRANASVRSVVYSPIEAHSKKPDEVRDRIVTLCGDLPRIELFARQKVDGWDSWGFDVSN